MSNPNRDPSNYGERTPEELVVTYAELIVGIEALRAAGVTGLETKKSLGSNYVKQRYNSKEIGEQEEHDE